MHKALNDPIAEVARQTLQCWLTSADQNRLFEPHELLFESYAGLQTLTTIQVDPSQTFQLIEGFGFSLTGGSALLISQLPDIQRQKLLRELFLVGEGIGVSVLRLSIGASDLSERCFTYLDHPLALDDWELTGFDLDAGDREVVPLLLEILQLKPELKLIATAWSAPAWMKTNGGFIGGKLKPECYALYAAYLVKYLLAMRERGIVIQAITPQNEPLNQKNEPSMIMQADEQAEFIKLHLGPQLRQAGLHDVKLWCWDHNCDVMDYPLRVFADKDASKFLSGSAWHLYGGDISALADVHELYPDKKLYFTEQWVGSDGEFGGDLMWHLRHVMIGATRNWSSMVLEWNLASDPFCGPHTPGGESRCVGALTIGEEIMRNVAYYVIAHAAKFIPPGSIRIASSTLEDLPNVAFATPSGDRVVIVLNDKEITQEFVLDDGRLQTCVTAPGRSVLTLVWT